MAIIIRYNKPKLSKLPPKLSLATSSVLSTEIMATGANLFSRAVTSTLVDLRRRTSTGSGERKARRATV